MKNSTNISKFDKENQPILADERSAQLRAAWSKILPDVIVEIKKSILVGQIKKQRVFIYRPFAGYEHQVGERWLDISIPSFDLHCFLSDYLLPQEPVLAQSTWYRNAVVKCFTKERLLFCRKKALIYRNTVCCNRIYIVSQNELMQIDSYFAWLRDFFGRTGIHLSDEMEEYCFRKFFIPVFNHRMNRVFAEFLIIAHHRSSLANTPFSHLVFIAEQIEKTVFQNGKVNALTFRNLAYTIVEFVEFALPILEKRFGVVFVKEFLVKESTANFFFAHWCWRKKRNFSLQIGLQELVPEEIQMVPASGMIRFLPSFLLLEIEDKYRRLTKDVFCILGNGKSIRNWAGLPRLFSAKAMHYFMNAPKNLSFSEALVYGRAMAELKEEQLALLISNHILGNIYPRIADEPILVEICRFFAINRSELRRNEVGPLLDFFNTKVLDPQFTLSGRTLNSVRRLMEDWHIELAQQRVLHGIPEKWEGSAVKGIQVTMEDKTFIVKQITKQKEIIAEGAAMRHCVASYARGCVQNHHSIWSLGVLDGKSFQRLVTIQLRADNVIVQARGLQNRMPTPAEVSIMEKWCAERGLSYWN